MSTSAGGDDNEVVAPRMARVMLPDPELELQTADYDSGNETTYNEVDELVEQEQEEDYLEDFPDETEDLELVHLRISSLTNLRLSRFANHLKRLCLRQNLISFLDPSVFHCLTRLEELDFYDNKIKKIGRALDNLSILSTLDFSFNLLRSVPECVEKLHKLNTLYLVQNRITRISNLTSCSNLRSLELGGNKIRKIENLEALVNLEELWLGKNKITKLENVGSLKNLKILSLQSNRITDIENIGELRNLEELYLSHNGVKRLQGLENNINLTTLDVGNNFIGVIENISHLQSLAELWINGNQISDLSGLEHIRSIGTLETLYLEANPCQATDMTGYRRKIMLSLPQLKQIDATYVRPNTF